MSSSKERTAPQLKQLRCCRALLTREKVELATFRRDAVCCKREGHKTALASTFRWLGLALQPHGEHLLPHHQDVRGCWTAAQAVAVPALLHVMVMLMLMLMLVLMMMVMVLM